MIVWGISHKTLEISICFPMACYWSPTTIVLLVLFTPKDPRSTRTEIPSTESRGILRNRDRELQYHDLLGLQYLSRTHFKPMYHLNFISRSIASTCTPQLDTLRGSNGCFPCHAAVCNMLVCPCDSVRCYRGTTSVDLRWRELLQQQVFLLQLNRRALGRGATELCRVGREPCATCGSSRAGLYIQHPDRRFGWMVGLEDLERRITGVLGRWNQLQHCTRFNRLQRLGHIGAELRQRSELCGNHGGEPVERLHLRGHLEGSNLLLLLVSTWARRYGVWLYSQVHSLREWTVRH